MKRVVGIILALAVLLCSCGNTAKPPPETQDPDLYFVGVWISYNELEKMLSLDYKTEFERAVSNCKSAGVTDIFLHTIPFCNPIYKSQYHPQNEKTKSLDFDVLEYSVTLCHRFGIRLHAWINPYRVSTATSNADELPTDSMAYIWTHDEIAENDKNICISNGLYLNPAESEVRALVINTVREIALNYEVDGIHFDDYFYPTTDENFDKQSYEEYKAQNQISLPLADFRRANVNGLISGVYTAVKFIDKDMIFSVSPAASLKRNYEEYYADVSAWCRAGCVDMIIPQLYFGYNYPIKEYRFEELLKVWKNAVKNTEVKLVIGLASYKIGTDAENDREDFADYKTIPREVATCREDAAISGHAFFSYGSFFSDAPLNKQSREEIIKEK